MSLSNGLNASGSTSTSNRTPRSVSPFSGMCTTCIEGCPGLCEVGKSAFRGREVLYPGPYGETTFASQKDYPVDFSQFNIMGTTVGAKGMEADSNKAIFSAVDVESHIGDEKPIKLKLPISIPGLGSTKIARDNWEGLAAGAAISGVILTIGENVCGMDENTEIKDGRVVNSPGLKGRVEAFRRWQGDYGEIVLQSNVEDTNLGVLEYALEKLGVTAVELKWGQGAKNIGGEVKVSSLKEALALQKRGYLVYPDPQHPHVQESFGKGVIKEFERHSRVGMVTEESFLARVAELRSMGARKVFLKTGAYRPADLARAVKYASKARIDLLTVDGAGGGTGMSPWRMMNEWGIPTVYLESLLYDFLVRIRARGEYVPGICVAGGFSLEDHVFKGLALGAPFVRAIGMARAPLTAVMVGKTLEEVIKGGKLPSHLAKTYGTGRDEIFSSLEDMKQLVGSKADILPPGALGLFTYFERIKTGLQQLMCGARTFSLNFMSRHDLAALTPEASQVSGIPFIMDLDRDESLRILNETTGSEAVTLRSLKCSCG